MRSTIIKAQDSWIPENITLEETALEVVKSNRNTLVIAGPGAGKTELLAQRACFLLQTNTCLYPKRILAVSFKRDSASNLEERVTKRCGPELACRFDSYTFDKFCKEILDRFILALPLPYRPDKNYRFDTNNELLIQAYELAGYPRPRLSTQDTKPQHPKKVLTIMIKGLPEYDFEPALNFNLISRLALYILKHNQCIRTALQKTYSHVFLDEFQDTTDLQYEIVETCFRGTSTVITAVGDRKQRIMIWAGAMPNIFEKYMADFNADSKTMIMNHRSAPQLILLQKALYKCLNEKDIDIIPSNKWNPNDGYVSIAIFEDERDEREFIKQRIIELLNEGVKPRDICILVKRSINDYLGDILDCSLVSDVKIRNEVIYQDLLKEEAVKAILAFLFCAISTSNPDAYMYLQDLDLQIKGIDIDDVHKVNAQNAILDKFVNLLSASLMHINVENGVTGLVDIINKIFDYLGEKTYRDYYPQYENGGFFEEVKENLISLLWEEYCLTGNWENALKSFEGEFSVPAMTIHKSKGLEFDTVFIVGIEDASFFADNRPLNKEDMSAVFVAISRAKRNLYISTANNRPSLQRGGGQQTYLQVKAVYDIISKLENVDIYNNIKSL